ncbi:class I SAM-dependent methyltransferase [Nocardioides lijunqiniae]|uniref:class I SAM-dependent methyltransferase n=1 Tax=Nocardioides lijunqiniae TaxID=2760832 RepID=UPI001877DFD3|nr:class I SAM-dependent methyltransferase [Nocardioides lijunqiniae]
MSIPTPSHTTPCRICGGAVERFLDLGDQPLSDAFRKPDESDDEFFFRLEVGRCTGCTMTQLLHEVPRERMFHADYPYRSSGSTTMAAHFRAIAQRFLAEELTGSDPFIVEIGSNDGVMLRTVAEAGVRHLGVDPSAGVGLTAQEQGVRVRTDFFEERSALEVVADEGRADVIYAANTFCHIPYLDSVLAGARALLGDDGIFVFEDPYIGDILRRRSFDQIYDEHFYFFSATSVRAMAVQHGFELVDVERLDVHGGEVRYTLARPGRRTVTQAVHDLLLEESTSGLDRAEPYETFARAVMAIRDDLRSTLERLRDEGRRVVGYGATAKSATVNNFCGIDRDLVAVVYDTTEEKQGRVTPGQHIPVEDMSGFATDPAPIALLYAWNHAEEIKRKEQAFADRGGRWLTYVPEVRLD